MSVLYSARINKLNFKTQTKHVWGLFNINNISNNYYNYNKTINDLLCWNEQQQKYHIIVSSVLKNIVWEKNLCCRLVS